MIRIIAKNFIKPDAVEKAKPLFREIVAASRKEPGCREYRLHCDEKEPGLFVFIEEWADQEILDKHNNSEHFKRIVPQIGELCSRPGEVLLLHGEI
jgi:quinol monooxygenase YgiN